MALTAIRAKLTVVLIIGVVTGVAILRSVREVGQGTGIHVALNAGHIRMSALGLEGEACVAETFTKAIHAVVAIEAGHPVGNGMGLGEDRIYLTVAAVAGVDRKGGNVALMAVVAGEGLIQSRLLVRGQ